MRGRSISFYLLPEDITKVGQYLNNEGAVILKRPIRSIPPERICAEALFGSPEGGNPRKYITTESFINRLNYQPAKAGYFLSESQNPIMSFGSPTFGQAGKRLTEGRLYYVPGIDDDFTKWCERVFRWFRRNFKNVGRKEFAAVVNQNTLDWLHAHPDHHISQFADSSHAFYE